MAQLSRASRTWDLDAEELRSPERALDGRRQSGLRKTKRGKASATSRRAPYESPSNWPFLRTEPRMRLERAVKALFLGFVRNNAYKRPASDPTVWVRT